MFPLCFTNLNILDTVCFAEKTTTTLDIVIKKGTDVIVMHGLVGECSFGTDNNRRSGTNPDIDFLSLLWKLGNGIPNEDRNNSKKG